MSFYNKWFGRTGVTRERTSRERAFFLILVLCVSTGCGSFWASVREGERSRSEKQANTYFKGGRCQRALDQLDRSEAAQDLGSYASDATYQRAVCLEKLGHKEAARANYLMILDFYPESRVKPLAMKQLAEPEFRDGFSKDQAGLSPLPMPSQVEMPGSRYSEAAERSGLVGDTVLVFTLEADQSVSGIRVLKMGHPLLASWAIESVSQATLREKAAPLPLPMQIITRVVFSSHWHGDGQEVSQEPK